MAKIFQLTVFMNFIGVGIVIGYSWTRVSRQRMLLVLIMYIIVYSLFGLVVLSDIDFLVPTP